MKIHVISETPYLMKATGVHTAFINHVNLLKEKDDVEVIINNEGRGDICHSHTYGLYYLWKARKYKGKRVFTVHVIPDSIKGSLPLWRFFMPFVKLGLKFVYSYSDICIAVSPAVEKAIADTGAKTRVIRIFNHIDPAVWKRTDQMRETGRSMMGISDNRFVVIGAGQLTGRKGIDDFLDIAADVPEADFVWAGGRPFGGFSEGILRINERIRGASPNFKRTGPFGLDMMPYVYAAGDLLLFPSYQENCPLVPIEAAASGMPVIFRDIDEYRTLYNNKYLKAGNNREFISLIRKLMTDNSFYNEGLSISANLLTQFDKETIRRELLTIYRSLIT